MIEECIFQKFSNDRDEQFCTITRIIQENNHRFVVKEAANPNADEHIRNIYKNKKLLDAKYKNSQMRFARSEYHDNVLKVEWVHGQSYAAYLDDLLDQDRIDECIQSIKKYFSQAFGVGVHVYQKDTGTEKYFGEHFPVPQAESVSVVDVDMLFENVIYREIDDIWIDYDYEWTLPCDIPVNFLIYRCLMYYIRTETRSKLIAANIYEQFDISETDRQFFEKMETGLQNYIAGSEIPIWRMREVIGMPMIPVLPMVKSRLKHLDSDVYFNAEPKSEVYFDIGQGFSQSYSKEVYPDEIGSGRFCVNIDVPESAVTIRFDPAQYPCILRVIHVWDNNQNRLEFQTNSSSVMEDEYLFLHGDSQIVIPLQEGLKNIQIEFELLLIVLENYDDLGKLEKHHQDMICKSEQLQSRNRQLQDQNDELKKANCELENMQLQTLQAYQHVVNSSSWKLTRPLRKVKQVAIKVKRRANVYVDKWTRKKILPKLEVSSFQPWIESLESDYEPYRELAYQPKISVIVPVYNVLDKHLIPCIESVLIQSYPNWELCISDDCSTWKNVRRTLKKYESNEKIKIVYRSENGHISINTNTALEEATGEYIAFLDCDDVLSPNALFEVVKVLNENPDLDFIYSDEDKIDDDGHKRFMPYFKSDWAPDTLMNYMYTCHLGVYRRRIAMDIGGLRAGFEGAQDYDFVLRFTEKTDKIAHISKILYHWRVRKESTAGTPEAKPYILEAAKKSQEEALARRGWKGEVELVKDSWQFRVNYFCDPWPKVSVIIPSKDNYEILKSCLDSFHAVTDYPDYEIILVDNGSNDENHKKYHGLAEKYQINYIYQKEPFNFSHMCNVGSRAAQGNYLLFLNDDIEIIDAKWLKRMVGQASREHTGAVGAKLLYPDRESIQHVGVLNLECGPSHALTGFSDKQIYYFGRNRMDCNYLAVTAACLLVKKEKFEEVSGFNEELAIAYNDVELCFHLAAKGYYNVVRNDAVLVHHESVSRGLDTLDQKKMERLTREREKLYDLYPQFYGYDPFYNRNLVQNNVDFSYNIQKKTALINQKVESLKTVKIKEQNFSVCLDEVVVQDQLSVKGWFYWRNSYRTNVCRVYVALKEQNGQTIFFDVNRVIRRDVAETGNNAAYNCGFTCRIPSEELKPQAEYQIGIMVETVRLKKRRICWTSAKTERCL